MNKSIKTLLLSAFLFAQVQTAHAVPVTYSVSGTTFEVISITPSGWNMGDEVAVTGSITIESESITEGNYVPTYSRQWNVVSGSLSIATYDLRDLYGNIYFNTTPPNWSLYDRTFRLLGEGADITVSSGGFGGASFYNADGSPVPDGPAVLDGPYSQLSPLIKLKEIIVRGPYGADGRREILYADGQIWLTQVPIPPAAWLFGSALGLMSVTRRKSVA